MVEGRPLLNGDMHRQAEKRNVPRFHDSHAAKYEMNDKLAASIAVAMKWTLFDLAQGPREKALDLV